MISNANSVPDFRHRSNCRNHRNQNYRVLRQGNAYRGGAYINSLARTGHAYRRALDSIPAPGGQGCHAHLLRVANYGVLSGLSDQRIIDDIRAHIPEGGRKVPDQEIIDAVSKAASELTPSASNRLRLKPSKRSEQRLGIKFNGISYRKKLIERGRGADEHAIRALSPVVPPAEPGTHAAALLLNTLYDPQEHLFIGDVYDRTVRTVQRHLARLACGDVPAHVIANPVDGQAHRLSSGKLSYRCDAAVCRFVFALVEYDDLSRDEQIAYWHSVIRNTLLPVSALIDSGGKSLHAWLNVSLPDKAAWDALVRKKLWHPETGLLRLQGADSACQNPSRLSRLPGHFRSENGRWQRLLYLNPNPTTTGRLAGKE